MKNQPNIQTPITHEQGGLEADVSGYSGLLKISGGATSQASPGVDYYEPGGGTVPVSDGGTGAFDPAGARTNLGLDIGSDVQAHGGLLDSLQGLSSSLAEGDILIVDANGLPTRLSAGSEGDILKIVSGVPAWGEDIGGGGLSIPSSAWGDGSDGPIIFSSDTTINTDINATTLTVNSGVKVTLGWIASDDRAPILRAQTSMMINGTINAAASTGLSAGALSGGGNGGNGGASSGGHGSPGQAGRYARGGMGGASNDIAYKPGNGGGGGTFEVSSDSLGSFSSSEIALIMGGGAGGGGGAASSDTTDFGGQQGGGGGGCAVLLSPSITGNGVIDCSGTYGPNQFKSNDEVGSGGGGGGGNAIILGLAISGIEIDLSGGFPADGDTDYYEFGAPGENGALLIASQSGNLSYIGTGISCAYKLVVN